MYSLVVMLSGFSDKMYVFISLTVACFLATAMFYLVTAPAHNLLKAYIAYREGDEKVKVRGHLKFRIKKSFNWVGVVSSLFLFMPIVHPVYYKNSNFYERNKGTVKIALSGVLCYFLFAITLTCIYQGLRAAGIYDITTATNTNFSPDLEKVIYHCIFSTVYFWSRLCYFATFINFLPIIPLDFGEILALVLRVNWIDFLKNNEVLVSFIVFFISLFTFARPSGLYSQWTKDIVNLIGMAF